MSVTFHQTAKTFSQLQESMVKQFEAADGSGTFKYHPWEKEIGTGITSVLQNGSIIEKAGVNFSKVSGPCTPALQNALQTKASTYSATGVSSIIHPQSPWIPIIHMNVRYFELSDGSAWFGGGIDLTPHYVIPEDAREFHISLKELCDRYTEQFYPKFKEWADRYFFLPHRNETRGVGGIFFDRIQASDYPLNNEAMTAFCCDLGNLYPKLYARLIDRYRDQWVSEREKQWQHIRRSRYVEFNLLYDRGTQFGLASGGNAESILISMPPQANWFYNFEPNQGSMEAETLTLLLV